MQLLVNNRWFCLTELIIVFTYGVFLTLQLQWGGWLATLILLPWLIRIGAGHVIIEKSAFSYHWR
jgi:hypothetical protein